MRRPTALGLLFATPLVALAACEESRPEEHADLGMGGGRTGGSAGTFAGALSGGSSSGSGSVGGGGSTGGVGGTAGASAGAASGGTVSGTAGAGMSGAGGTTSGGGGQPGGFGGTTGGGAGNAGNAGAPGTGGSGGSRPMRVLLYSFSTLDIPSVPAQLALFEQQLESWSYEVDPSEDPAVFTDANLANYAAVGMINTCFYPFGANNTTGEPQSGVLQRFLRQGGGLFGTHCADVTFQSANPPALYNQLIGGRASSENFEGRSDCRTTGAHPTTQALPSTFAYTGNLDNTNYLAEDSVVLVRCRWGNTAGTDVAVSWVRSEGAGRVFFTNFGKVDADLRDATIGENHILAGLAWVLGQPI